MKAIMISDKPKWCALMMNGDKRTEIRKHKALLRAIQKLITKYGHADIYVCCTKDSKGQLHYSKEYGAFYDIYNGPEHYSENGNLNGKVVFKFRCYKLEEIAPFEEYESPFGMAYKLTKEKIINCQRAQLTYDEYNRYLKGKNGGAIHISDLEIFDKPKEISEFYGVKQYFIGCESGIDKTPRYARLTKAPQNFCYIEV